MIQFSTNVQNAIANKPTEYFHLIKIVDNENVVIKAITSHSSNLIVGGITYNASGELVSIDPPSISTTVDREQFKFVIADPDFSQTVMIEPSMINHSVEVRLGFLHHSTKLPMTSLEDTIFVYGGRVDGTGYQIKTDGIGEALLQISCASPLADLDMKRAMYLSKDYIRGRNPNDSSCDMVYGGSGLLQLKWGKP
jgi:hypothetical protein